MVCALHIDNFNASRRDSKLLLYAKYHDYLNNIELCLHSNPKTFWNFVKANNKNTTNPVFVKSGATFASSATEKASIFNTYFQSMFTHDGSVTDLDPGIFPHNISETQLPEQLSEIHISVEEVESSPKQVDLTAYLDNYLS